MQRKEILFGLPHHSYHTHRHIILLIHLGCVLLLQIPNKVRRYIFRNAHDQASLQRYLVKSTVNELQALKAEALPWREWDMGQKATQAAELAEWLWWLAFTWPRLHAQAGAAAMPML
jgi:hypothetical protein